MGKKTTKRTKKFLKKGGIKKHLSKGSITNKGKVKLKHPPKSSSKQSTDAATRSEEEDRKQKLLNEKEEQKQTLRNQRDFTSEKNLGDLDMDTFFEEVVAEEEETKKEEEEEVVAGEDAESSSSEEEDSENEEDIEAAEERMKRELETLESKDPEFHAYLKENESSLLEFGHDDENDGAMEETKQEQDHKHERKTSQTKISKQTKEQTKEESSNSVTVTLSLLKRYEESAFEHHATRGLRRIVAAYRSACHLGDVDTEKGEPKISYVIDDSVVFDRLMMLALTRCHEAFYYHLVGDGARQRGSDHSQQQPNKKTKRSKPSKEDKIDSTTVNVEEDSAAEAFDPNKPLHPKQLSKAPHFKPLSLIIQSFFKSTIHLLSTSTQHQLLIILLKHMTNYIPFLTLFPILASRLLKLFTHKWISPAFETTQHQSIHLQAFLRIRQLALTQPFPFIEDCLKTTYLAFAKHSKFISEASLPTLTFRGNCLVELYGLDPDASYQHAFVYIRQLSLLLRNATIRKTKQSFLSVYCWQYLHCLNVWVAVLSNCARDTEMKQLIYPLVEVIMGVIRLLPNARYLPLRLHCVRMLQQLAASSESFIPTTSVLLDILDMPDLYKKPKKLTKKAEGIRMALLLKLPKEDTLRTKEQLDAVLEEVFVLLGREVDLYRYSTGFAEFGIKICARLRKFNKQTRDMRWRTFSKACIETAERHSEFCIKARSELDLAPKDVNRLEILKPGKEGTMKERYDASVAKEKRLEQATQPEVSKTMVEKKKEEEVVKKKKKKEKEGKRKREEKKGVKDLRKDDGEGVLEEEDEVEEGIDWSDVEEEVHDDNDDDDDDDDDDDVSDEDDSEEEEEEE